MPYRRAVAATWRGACKLSRTILSFSSSDQRRRRPVSTTSSRSTWALRLSLSIRTVLNNTPHSARPAFTGRILPVKPLSSVVVSFYLPNPTKLASVHWEAMQTGYISGSGDMTKAADFKSESITRSRLLLSRILTTAKPDSSAIVVLGDSITDGICSTPDSNHRWTDELASRLQAEGHRNIAVVNEAFYGNRVLADGEAFLCPWSSGRRNKLAWDREI